MPQQWGGAGRNAQNHSRIRWAGSAPAWAQAQRQWIKKPRVRPASRLVLSALKAQRNGMEKPT